MYENNNQGEKDLTNARVTELKAAGWAVPLDSEAVEDGARNIRLNASLTEYKLTSSLESALETLNEPIQIASIQASEAKRLAESASNSLENIRGNLASHEIRIGATEQANQELNGRVQALENTPAAPAPSPAPVSGSGLSGPGRPDVSSTLSRELASAVAAAPVGSVFSSTDGAGVGAWAWQKTPGDWTVTYGNTGWRRLTSTIYAARIGPTVFVSFRGQTVPAQSNLITLTGALAVDNPSTNSATLGIVITSQGAIAGRVTAWGGTLQYWPTDSKQQGKQFTQVFAIPAANKWGSDLPGNPA